MTTPSSPPISLHDVGTELGVSSAGLSLSDSRVRTLAGVPSGAISLHDLLGKSAYTPMSPNIGGDQSANDFSGSHNFSLSCNPNGGIASYSYLWSIPSQGGSAPGSATITGSSTTQSTTVGISTGAGGVGSEYGCGVICTVTDGKGNNVASNEVSLGYEFG